MQGVARLKTWDDSEVGYEVLLKTGRKLREEFPHLQHLLSLWTRSYFAYTAGNVSRETIKRYVEQQKTRG